MSQSLKEAIKRQRENLKAMLRSPLEALARQAASVWPEREALDRLIFEGIHTVPYCKYLYVMDTDARQVTANANRDGLMPEDYGRDRSRRPYMPEVVPEEGFLLSDSYISLRAHRPSVTAVQVVRGDEQRPVLGFLGADFDLRDLPLTQPLYAETQSWRQVKGDPAIRGALFAQSRFDSPLDRRIDDVLYLAEELIVDHGVFHLKLHFSSSRATVWTLDDPYRYRILEVDDLLDPDIAFAYPLHPYPEDAELPAHAVGPILKTFRRLRFMDETIYLRSATINLFNGLINLTFSCDGSHYMPWREFINKDLSFWEGSGAANPGKT